MSLQLSKHAPAQNQCVTKHKMMNASNLIKRYFLHNSEHHLVSIIANVVGITAAFHNGSLALHDYSGKQHTALAISCATQHDSGTHHHRSATRIGLTVTRAANNQQCPFNRPSVTSRTRKHRLDKSSQPTLHMLAQP